MASTITTADEILKEDYQELVDQLSNTTVLVAQLEKSRETADGRRAVHALHVGRNGGIGGAETGGAMPTPGNQRYTNTYVPLRKRYAAIQVERQLFKITDTNAGAFADAVNEEMRRVKNDVRVDEGRQSYGTSDGVVAATGITAASTTVVLATTTTATQLRQLEDFAGPAGEGRLIDIGTVAAPTGVASARTLLSVDVAAKTIEISGAAVTTAVTDRIFFSGQGGASTNSGFQNDGQIELTGLSTIVSDTATLHGLTVAAEPAWKSYVSSNGGTLRQVSENLINNAIFNVETRSEGAVDLLISNFGVYAALAADMRAMRRNNDTVALKAGFSGIAYSVPGQGNDGPTTRTIVWDRDCPNNTLFGVTTSDIKNYEASGWEWRDETGAIWQQAFNGAGAATDAYVARMARYHDFAAHRRNSHFKITDLAEAAG